MVDDKIDWLVAEVKLLLDVVESTPELHEEYITAKYARKAATSVSSNPDAGQQPSMWVPVERGCPTEPGKVLVWVRHADGRSDVLDWRASGMITGGGTAAGWVITHWMPLPHGPDGERSTSAWGMYP